MADYFEDNTPDGIIARAVEEIEFRVTGNKISKISDPVGGKLLESTSDGSVKETDSSIDSLIHCIKSSRGDGILIVSDGDGGIHESSKTLNVLIEDIAKLCNAPQFVEIGHITGFPENSESVDFFPTYLLTSQPTKITRADVFVELKPVPGDEHLARIYNTYTGGLSKMSLDICVKTDDEKKSKTSYDLAPITKTTYSVPMNHQFSASTLYNAAISFKDYNVAKYIFKSASVRLIHTA